MFSMLAVLDGDCNVDLVMQTVNGRGVHAVFRIRPSNLRFALHNSGELAHSAERSLSRSTTGQHRLGEEHAVLIEVGNVAAQLASLVEARDRLARSS